MLCGALVVLILSSCLGDGIHGLSERQWLDTLSAGNALPLPDGRKPDYRALSTLGPGSLLFLAYHAEALGDEALRRGFLLESAKREPGRYGRRAAELLVKDAEGDATAMLKLLSGPAGKALSADRRMTLDAKALLDLGRKREALAMLVETRKLYGSDGMPGAELLALIVEAGASAGANGWAEEFRLLFSMELAPDIRNPVARALSAAEALPAPSRDGLEESELVLARARLLSSTREYGASVRQFKLYSSLPGIADSMAALIRALPRQAASDAARAFLYGAPDEGAAIWKELAEDARNARLAPDAAFHALFWHGRFARNAERWQEAAAAFSQAAPLASAPADLDASLWYRVECLSRLSTAQAAQALAEALALSANPSYYGDLVEPLSRAALLARDGATLATLERAAALSGTEKDAARLSYLAARAAAAGIIRPAHMGGETPENYQTARLERAYRQQTDAWYRLLAAFRLGLPLVEPADGPGSPPPQNGEEPEAGAAILAADADEYALGLIKFGLAHRIRSELPGEWRGLGAATLRAASESLSRAGNDSEALRVIAPLFSRTAYAPQARDRELYWPRAYREELEAAAARHGLSAYLLYGLVRSESLFQPAVVSSAGAVGLAQLMPATAEETAARLRMASYELTDPADNLELGAAYFKRLLDRLDGRILPALFSYNAGLTRYRRWEEAAKGLPADLLLETLAYAETRQYGRNVAGAAAAYAALYGEENLEGFMALLLGER